MNSEMIPPGHARLSLSMIVRNEERFLDGCLASVREVADEMIIVDTGSTDGTVGIAQRYGARVIEHPWNDDFSAARNESLRHCTADWVLYLDADERLSQGQCEAIGVLLNDTSAAAYNVIVRNTLSLPTGTSIQLMPYPRLFRRTPGVRFEGCVHEQLAPSIEVTGGKIVPCALVIEHLGYNQGFDVLKEKTERNLRLLLAQREASPDNGYSSFQIGNTLLMFQQFSEAKDHFARALASSSLSRNLRAQVYNLLAEAELRTGFPSRAAEYCRESLRLARHQMAARWYLVGASIRQQDYTGAHEVCKEILAVSIRDAASGTIEVPLDLQIDEGTVLHVMGQCEMKLGDPCAAVRTFSRALELGSDAPDLTASYREANVQCADQTRAKAEQLMERGDYRKAGGLIDEAEARGTRSFALERLGVDLALRERDLEKARHHLERMAGYIPEDNPAAKQQLLALAAKLVGAEAPA